MTHFRPAYTAYPKISDAIQVAMEAVMTGQSLGQDARPASRDTVKSIVGATVTTMTKQIVTAAR